MSKSPDLNKQPMTFMVPSHLAEAFKQTVSDFFENAKDGSTPAQRAAEVRAQDNDDGLDSLAHLVGVAEGGSSQGSVVARFLANLYSGCEYSFDLAELRELDDDVLEHCLQVLRLDSRNCVDVQRYFPQGDARWQAIIKRWGIVRSDPQTPPDDELVYSCQYESKQDAPGYRDVTVFVKLAAGIDELRTIGLAFSAADSERLVADLVSVHRLAWARGKPLDADQDEPRPTWL